MVLAGPNALVFLVKNCGWRRDLLCHKPLGLALVVGPNVVGSGLQSRPKTLPKDANSVEPCLPTRPNKVFDYGRHYSAIVKHTIGSCVNVLMAIDNKSPDHHRHALHYEKDHVTTLSVTRRKAIFEQTVASHAQLKKH